MNYVRFWHTIFIYYTLMVRRTLPKPNAFRKTYRYRILFFNRILLYFL